MTTQSTTQKVQFLENHRPAMEAGDYTITVQQTITIDNQAGYSDSEVPQVTRSFSVLGPRFNIDPQEIKAVFPPPGSLGDHSNVLPHVILKRSTLPWERNADHVSEATPWLALLLFTETEIQTVESKTVSLNELKTSVNGIHFPQYLSPGATLPTTTPYLRHEYGDHDDDKITVIDVPMNTLNTMMPTKEELKWLTHARQPMDGHDQAVGEELAIIIGNRLPLAGQTSTAHLVSAEGFYKSEGDDDVSFWYHSETTGNVRLISLKSWQFSCVTPDHSFRELVKHLNQTPTTLNLPTTGLSGEAQTRLAQGNVPLPHAMRQGNQTVSWYHGPLLPGPQTTTVDITLPIRTADQLIRYNSEYSMFDVSYAAAWELGRLLALQSKSFSLNLYNWKRGHAQQQKAVEQAVSHPFAPPTNAPPLPDSVADWFARLARLDGVPFNYLVPQEAMIPPESLRFFYLDSFWLECLLDGAFSIGRVSTADQTRDGGHASSPAANPHGIVTGVLMRSQVVSGWPHLQVDGYPTILGDLEMPSAESRLPVLRMDRLSANLLLCLFQGEAQTVDFHIQPEGLHFGLDMNDDGTQFHKVLRNSDGEEAVSLTISDIPWQDEAKRIININDFASKIRTRLSVAEDDFTSAQFALQMIEGTPTVRFTAN